MSHDEMRFLRRELINEYLPRPNDSVKMTLHDMKMWIRFVEFVDYGRELNLYKDNKS